MANVFPFSALDTQLLPRVADELAAPYQQRLESEVRDVIETQRLLLLRGPAGLGKTREAFEATKRLAQQRDSLTVLVPNTAQTDVAWEWPEGLPDHEVVLFADNLHGRYVRPASGVPLGGGQQNWLHDTMRRFGSREQRLRVIATIRDDEPDGRVWRQQLGYTQGHRFWRQFGDVLQLGDWDYEAKLELINDYAKVSNLTLEDGAAQLLARRTDGRARTILMALKLMPGASVTRAMVEAAPASYRNATDEAWAKIAPFPERAAWIEALALCREADLTATRPLVEGIARLLLPRVPWPNSTLSRPRRVIGTLQALWTARLSRRQRLNDALRNTPAVEVRRDGRLSADDLLLDGRASLRDHALLVRRVVTSLLWEAGGPNAADLAAFGRRLHAMASRQEPELLEAAIDCYQDALAQYRDDDHPADWAQTQNNLGAALWDPLQRDKRSNLEAAIRCFEAALTVYNEQDYPADWAWTQNKPGERPAVPVGGRQAQQPGGGRPLPRSGANGVQRAGLPGGLGLDPEKPGDRPGGPTGGRQAQQPGGRHPLLRGGPPGGDCRRPLVRTSGPSRKPAAHPKGAAGGGGAAHGGAPRDYVQAGAGDWGPASWANGRSRRVGNPSGVPAVKRDAGAQGGGYGEEYGAQCRAGCLRRSVLRRLPCRDRCLA